jgi:heme/copper-type cytochrome/quinol oxidase subunit 2
MLSVINVSFINKKIKMKTIFKNLSSICLTLVTLTFLVVESLFINLTESISAPWQLYFQDPETPIMEGIINFHDKAMFLITFIIFAVGYILFRAVVLFQDKNENRPSERFIHGTVIEIVWTILPALVLLNLAIPSFSLLYSMDELPTPQGTLKCIGHQWYWSYEYSDNYTNNSSGSITTSAFERTPTYQYYDNLNPFVAPKFNSNDTPAQVRLCVNEFSNQVNNSDTSLLESFNGINEDAALISSRWAWDSSAPHTLSSVTSFETGSEESTPVFQNYETESYLVNEAVDEDYYRLLSVDNSAKIPAKRHIRILITSADVLHSWAVPSLGIKVDACPGRLNQTSTYLSRAGIKHYGQCSEICGVNHGFMPIVVESFNTSSEDYLDIPLENRHKIVSA